MPHRPAHREFPGGIIIETAIQITESAIRTALSWIGANTTTAIFFAIIGVVSLFAYLRYYLPLRRRAKAFRKARDRVAGQEGDQFPTAPFPTSFDWLNELWREYASTYEQAAVEIQNAQVSPVPPESVFTRPKVLREYNRKTAVALAGVFLALGILGTFWGLVLGLQSVDTSQEQLLSSVTSLLSGMSTAFWSSIGGITVSIAWLLADRWAFNRLRSRVERFFTTVRRRWPATSPERAAFKTLELQVEQKVILQNLGTDLAQAFQQAIDQSFTQQLSPALDSIDETLDRVASRVSDEQAEALDEMAAAFQDRLLDSVEEQFGELAHVIEDATEWQRRVTNDVGSLFEQVSELSETNTELLKNSSEAAERFLASIDRLSESQERLYETSERLEQVASQMARLSQELQGQNEVFVAANEDIREELAQQLDLMEEQVSSLSEFWTELHEDLEDLGDGLSRNLTEFTEMTGEKLEEVFHRFDSEMSTVVEHLAGTLAELREVTEELGPTIAHVESAIEETIEPISESREEAAALARSIQSLEGLPDRLDTASSEMQNAREALVDLGDQIESLEKVREDGDRTTDRGSSSSEEDEEEDSSGLSWFRR